jgi:subtilisin family serine protease
MSTGSRRRFSRAHDLQVVPERNERPHDVLIVKLKADRTPIEPEAAFRRALAVAGGARRPLLRLVEDGYVREVSPIFAPAMPAAFEGVAPSVRNLALAMSSTPRLKRARGLVQIRIDPSTNAEHLAAHLRSMGDQVEYAYVPPVKYPMVARRGTATKRTRAGGASNDPLQSRQWGHSAVKIFQARSRTAFKDASGVVVAVVDTGIDEEHPDLQGSIHSYVNYLKPSEGDHDYVGHGTHVSGIIAAQINNEVGVAGLCNARIMALKALPRKGNAWNPQAYYKALGHPIDTVAKVVNLSLGGEVDPGERDIVLDLLDAGITVVAAMGNEYEEGNPVEYPAAYPGVIAVGASDEVDRRASFSCTGKHIALVAPGERILSTVPHHPAEYAADLLYDSWPGTSMAAPHVAAAAALLIAKKPTITPADVRKRLTSSAEKTSWQTRRPSSSYGHGRLDIAAALA